jgi:hypothetical protein
VTSCQTLHFVIPRERHTLCGRFIYNSLSLRMTSDAAAMAQAPANPCRTCSGILEKAQTETG